MNIRFRKFSDNAITPTYAHLGDSGMDLHVANLGEFDGLLWPGQTVVVWSDIGIEIPAVHGGCEAQVRPRSSVSKRGLLVHLGTLDQGYRGNIGITVTNVSLEQVKISVGDRLAQLVFAPVIHAELFECDLLGESVRGEAGYGSSGQ